MRPRAVHGDPITTVEPQALSSDFIRVAGKKFFALHEGRMTLHLPIPYRQI
jgi:hypothetical protein